MADAPDYGPIIGVSEQDVPEYAPGSDQPIPGKGEHIRTVKYANGRSETYSSAIDDPQRPDIGASPIYGRLTSYKDDPTQEREYRLQQKAGGGAGDEAPYFAADGQTQVGTRNSITGHVTMFPNAVLRPPSAASAHNFNTGDKNWDAYLDAVGGGHVPGLRLEMTPNPDVPGQMLPNVVPYTPPVTPEQQAVIDRDRAAIAPVRYDANGAPISAAQDTSQRGWGQLSQAEQAQQIKTMFDLLNQGGKEGFDDPLALQKAMQDTQQTQHTMAANEGTYDINRSNAIRGITQDQVDNLIKGVLPMAVGPGFADTASGLLNQYQHNMQIPGQPAAAPITPSTFMLPPVDLGAYYRNTMAQTGQQLPTAAERFGPTQPLDTTGQQQAAAYLRSLQPGQLPPIDPAVIARMQARNGQQPPQPAA